MLAVCIDAFKPNFAFDKMTRDSYRRGDHIFANCHGYHLKPIMQDCVNIEPPMF